MGLCETHCLLSVALQTGFPLRVFLIPYITGKTKSRNCVPFKHSRHAMHNLLTKYPKGIFKTSTLIFPFKICWKTLLFSNNTVQVSAKAKKNKTPLLCNILKDPTSWKRILFYNCLTVMTQDVLQFLIVHLSYSLRCWSLSCYVFSI